MTEKQTEPQLALNDLLGIFEGKNLAFLKSYYDESYSHVNASPRWWVVGGCTMSNESWGILSDQWSAVLRDIGISAYRSSDCNASRNEYEGWNGPRKDELRDRLIKVINQSWRGKCAPICPTFTWSILDLDAFNEISLEYPIIQVSAYEFSILAIVAGSVSSITNLSGGHTLSLSFEAGQPVRPHIRALLQKIVGSDIRIVDISFVTKADHVPLQVADMIAYEALKSQHEGTRKVLVDLIGSGTGGHVPIDKDMIRQTFNSWLKLSMT